MSLAWRCRFWGRPLSKCYRAKTEAAILHQEGCSFFAQVPEHLVWQLGRSNTGPTLNFATCFAARWLLLQVVRMKVLAVPPKQRSNSSVVCGLEACRSFANSPWTQQHVRPFKVIIRPVLLDRITHWAAQLLPFGILFNKFCGREGGGRKGEGEVVGIQHQKTSVTPAVSNQFSHRHLFASLDLQMFTCESS